jgi:hypothetical protein
LKIINERDSYKQKLYYDKSYRDAERKEIESQLAQLKEELTNEQKSSKDKHARYEEVSKHE